jgi:hypothetical protein
MSSLDKEKTLDAFTAAYKKANGKTPNVEAANGWYSVDGGKNMRLAQLDEWRQELEGGKAETKKSANDKKAASASKKTTTKKSASGNNTKRGKKSTGKSKSQGAGTPAQLWRDQLQAEPGLSRLPRGMKS